MSPGNNLGWEFFCRDTKRSSSNEAGRELEGAALDLTTRKNLKSSEQEATTWRLHISFKTFPCIYFIFKVDICFNYLYTAAKHGKNKTSDKEIFLNKATKTLWMLEVCWGLCWMSRRTWGNSAAWCHLNSCCWKFTAITLITGSLFLAVPSQTEMCQFAFQSPVLNSVCKAILSAKSLQFTQNASALHWLAVWKLPWVFPRVTSSTFRFQDHQKGISCHQDLILLIQTWNMTSCFEGAH